MRAIAGDGGFGGNDGFHGIGSGASARRARPSVIGATCLALALLLPAGPALAQAINKNLVITDSTDPDTTANISHLNASNSGTGRTICRQGSNTVTFSAATTHPDFVRLVANKGRMDQRVFGNFPTLRVQAAGAVVYNIVLACSTAATWRSDVDQRPNVNSGSFRVDGQNCTGLNQAQVDYFRNTCAADVDNTTIQIQTEGTTILRVRLRGSGTAL